MSFETRIDRICADNPAAPRDLILATRLLMRTARLLREHIDRALVPFDLNMSQYLAMSMLLADEGKPTMPSELGLTLEATRTQVTRLLDGLEARELVRRHASTQDRRSLELSLTPAGRRLLARAGPVVHAAYGEAWTGVDNQGLANVTRALGQLHQTLGTLQS